ncbi:uncharacterized protein LOC110368377 [Fundulus heteroclitus]|uniref:uncharacterized protein LOC110368377 n=1 Tax=Fundulus heteroclitus TaxID=8078 RepID=UPI00165B1630|nr:uncharacterized protein LOC110368377 [Fundulus heteroclitus]
MAHSDLTGEQKESYVNKEMNKFKRTTVPKLLTAEDMDQAETAIIKYCQAHDTPTHPAGLVPHSVSREEETPTDGVRAPRPGQGTGYRHRVMQWGYSRVSRRRRKFVLLAEAPEKKFALLVGDSNLQAIVDGFVTMPKSTFSLGVLSSPGASADELRREVLDTVLPRTPDVICLLAPSNNLSSSTTYQEAGRDFDSLLHTISNLCANVVVLDFPPRLIVEEREQALLRQEYSRVATKRSVRYLPVTEHFPLSHLDMWSRDGVHLSDAPGMEVLAKLLWAAVSTQLQLSAPVSESLALSAFPPLSACPPVSLPACPPVSLPACPPVSLPACPPVSLPACPPVSLPACPPVSLPACPPVSLPACPPVSLPACPPVSLPACPPVSLPACPPVSLPACPPVSLPACPPVSLPACPPVSLPACPPVSLPACPPVSLPACPPVSLPACPPVSLPACPPVSLPACPPVSVSDFPPLSVSPSCTVPASPSSVSVMRPVPASPHVSARHPFPRLVVDGKGPGQSASHPFHGTVVGGGQKASVLEPCVRGPPVLSVRATHSQADKRYDKFSRNHQCTCMALTFLAYHNEGLEFNTMLLDRVIMKGDKLYVATKRQLLMNRTFEDNHLTFEEMPRNVMTERNLYEVHTTGLRVGRVFAPSESPQRSRQMALSLGEELRSENVTHAFLLVTPECIAIFRDRDGRFGVFDSHSRNFAGLPQPYGTAIMMTFSNRTTMLKHLQRLFQNRGPNATYEFVPVGFVRNNGNNDLPQDLTFQNVSLRPTHANPTVRKPESALNEDKMPPWLKEMDNVFEEVSPTAKASQPVGKPKILMKRKCLHG